MSRYTFCPRCGELACELLKSYSHCVNCNYSPTLDEKAGSYLEVPDWAFQQLEKGFFGTNSETKGKHRSDIASEHPKRGAHAL